MTSTLLNQQPVLSTFAQPTDPDSADHPGIPAVPVARAGLPDRSWHDATGRACGSAGDLVYGDGVQVCLPVQVLATVSLRVRAAARASLSMTEATDRQRDIITTVAGQIAAQNAAAGPWQMGKIAVNSWFLPQAGMLEDAALAAAAARAIFLATETPTPDETIAEIVHHSAGHGAGLALRGLTVTANGAIMRRYPWVPDLHIVSIIPVRPDRTPPPMTTLTGSDPAPGLDRLEQAVAAADPNLLAQLATATADTSGHPTLELLDTLSGPLNESGLTPIGRIVSHHGPAAGLLFPAGENGRRDAAAAIYLAATLLQDTVRVNCARTARCTPTDA